MTARIRILDVEPLHRYTLRVAFSDGSSREIDLEPELWGPMFEPLRDLNEFRKVMFDRELGTIVWPNGADLDPDVLYGDFSAVEPPATATG
jgi:hypothetical protein